MLVLPWNERYEPHHVDYLAEAIAEAVSALRRSPNVSESIAFGLIGAGGIAQSYLQAFAGLKEAQIAAVADVRLDAAASAAEALGCDAFVSWEELADRRGARRGAHLHAAHHRMPRSPCTFSRGASPCCARSRFAVDLAGACALAEASEANAHAADDGVEVPLRRRTSSEPRASSTSGILGDIILFENVFASRAKMSNRWNSDPAVSGGGVLIDNGTHSVDIMRYFLGPIAEVLAVEGKRVQTLAVEDTVQHVRAGRRAALAARSTCHGASTRSATATSRFTARTARCGSAGRSRSFGRRPVPTGWCSAPATTRSAP